MGNGHTRTAILQAARMYCVCHTHTQYTLGQTDTRGRVSGRVCGARAGQGRNTLCPVVLWQGQGQGQGEPQGKRRLGQGATGVGGVA